MHADHFEAVKDRLEEHIGLAGKVFDTIRENADGELIRANYVILHGGLPAELGGDRAVRRQVFEDNATYDYTVEAVGITADVVRQMLDAADAQLIGWVPDIPGRVGYRTKFSGGTPPRPINAVKPRLFSGDHEYEVRTHFTNSGS